MKNFLGDKNVPISTVLNTKLPSTMLCLSGFELYSRWVPQAYCRYYQMNCNNIGMSKFNLSQSLKKNLN